MAWMGRPHEPDGYWPRFGDERDRVRNLERDGLAGLRRVSDQVEAYVAS